MADEIYRVIKIIDEYNIVINAGYNKAIKEGDKLEIFIKGEPIEDPETHEKLGTLDTIKAKLIVKQVFPRFCICGNSETTGTYSALTSFAIAVNNTNIEPKKLNINPKEITGGFRGEDKTIKIGDLIRKSLSQS